MVLIASYAPAATTAYNTFTTAQNVMATTLYVPPNVLDASSGYEVSTSGTAMPGVIRVHAWGAYSTTGTPTCKVGIQALQAGTALDLGTTASNFTTPTGASNLGWNLTWVGAADVRGSVGQITASGLACFSAASGADSATFPLAPAEAPATPILYAFNEPAQWSVFWTWGTSSASNSVTVFGMTIEVL